MKIEKFPILWVLILLTMQHGYVQISLLNILECKNNYHLEGYLVKETSKIDQWKYITLLYSGGL